MKRILFILSATLALVSACNKPDPAKPSEEKTRIDTVYVTVRDTVRERVEVRDTIREKELVRDTVREKEIVRDTLLVDALQSVTFIPGEIADGVQVIYFKKGSNSFTSPEDVQLQFALAPARLASAIAANWQKSLSLDGIYTATRATSFVNIPIKSCSEKNGVLTLAVDFSGLDASFFQQSSGFSFRLRIADAESEISSSFVKAIQRPIVGEVPQCQVANATSSTLAFKWSCNGYSNVAEDISSEYRVALYRDEAMKDMVVSWTIPAKDEVYASNQPAFMFSGLKSDTDYWFTVQNTANNVKSSAKGHTTPFTHKNVGAAASANVGDVILAEDFHDLVWGGDYFGKACGYSATNRGSATSLTQASGENPIGQDYGWYLVANTVGMYMFSTIEKALPADGLKKWGILAENSTKTIANARAGFVVMGSSAYTGKLVTPVLSSLKGEATVSVEFDAAHFAEDDASYGSVMAIGAPSMNADHLIGGVTYVKAVFSPEKDLKWHHYSFTISGIKPTYRIGIGPERTSSSIPGKSNQRMSLDNIVIKLVSY